MKFCTLDTGQDTSSRHPSIKRDHGYVGRRFPVQRLLWLKIPMLEWQSLPQWSQVIMWPACHSGCVPSSESSSGQSVGAAAVQTGQDKINTKLTRFNSCNELRNLPVALVLFILSVNFMIENVSTFNNVFLPCYMSVSSLVLQHVRPPVLWDVHP